LLAAELGHTELVSLLLEYGANTQLKYNDGMTATEVAKNQEIKEMLLAAAEP